VLTGYDTRAEGLLGKIRKQWWNCFIQVALRQNIVLVDWNSLIPAIAKKVCGACLGFGYARAAEVSIMMAEPAFGSPTRCANEYAFGGKCRRRFFDLLMVEGRVKGCR
jgi:hypothetical protein